jgi:ABC-type branched-subunit amino acid transport system substrate-binding protein
MKPCLAGKILLGVLLVFLAIPVHGWSENPSAERSPASDELDKGQELYRQGHSEEAYRMLTRAVFRTPDSPANFPAFHTLARIFLDRNQPDRALAILSRIPEKNRTDLTRILRGNALMRSGYMDEGFSQLSRIVPDALPDEEHSLYFEALATGTVRRGKPLEALFFLHKASSLTAGAPDRTRIFTAVSQIGREMAGSPEAREARFMFQDTATGQVLSLCEAEKLAQEGKNGEALSLIQPVLESRIDFPFRSAAAELYHRITGSAWEQLHTIGVLLPLSGQYASFGKMVRRGMELALDSFRREGKGGGRFLFRDTAADPAQTVAAVRELSQQERVTALLGPLSGAAAEAGARQAQQEGVPLLALSPRKGIPEIGSFVFRTSLTGEAQVDTLLSYAVTRRGLTRFAVLYPADAMGREFAELFTRKAAELGGRVVVSSSYRADATDFREPILRLLGGNDPAVQKPVPFEALFIPDYGERVGLLVSQLPYYDVEGVQLLGINSWNTPELVPRGGRALEGAVFTDGFFSGSSRPGVQEFVKGFRERFGEAPSILDAQGYDAASLVLALLQDPLVRTRQELQQAFSRLHDFPGITGALSFRENGEGEKSLYLLQIRDGVVAEAG